MENELGKACAALDDLNDLQNDLNKFKEPLSAIVIFANNCIQRSKEFLTVKIEELSK